MKDAAVARTAATLRAFFIETAPCSCDTDYPLIRERPRGSAGFLRPDRPE
jgi:hypothetical protein